MSSIRLIYLMLLKKNHAKKLLIMMDPKKEMI